jgi:hypothetical protein
MRQVRFVLRIGFFSDFCCLVSLAHNRVRGLIVCASGASLFCCINMDNQAKQIENMATQDMFKKMTSTCFTKCVRRYDDGEVTVGEGEPWICVFFFFDKRKKVLVLTDVCTNIWIVTKL